jgi:hypothetical protein
MLSHLSLTRLRFGLTVDTQADLPPYKGDLLRRALLWQLGPLWCRQPPRCPNGCQQPAHCLFGQLLEPVASSSWDPAILRLMGPTPPPAYVLWDEQDRRLALPPGSTFHFQITLIGPAAQRQLPVFIAAFLAAAEQGIGKERLHGPIHQVSVLTDPTQPPHPLLHQGTWHGDATPAPTSSLADGQRWAAAVAPNPVTSFALHFLSPLHVEVRGQQVQTPDFVAIARAIVRRLRILSQVYGAGPWPQSDYGPLLDLAEQVQLAHHETTWITSNRRSQHGGTMPMEGLVGQAWYHAPIDLRPLLPILWLGQWVHAGKAAVWGNGRFDVRLDP